jgi:DNA helicase-2/ATP-dependent DNA helicase PcrA
MDIHEHPEYPEESTRLMNTLEAIRQVLQDLDRRQVVGADEWAEYNMLRQIARRHELISQSQSSPYFGRLDFAASGEQPEKFYIGYQALPLGSWEVIDWRAPLGKLFYSGMAEDQSYNSPEGEVSGRLSLKRRYQIEGGQLLDILDEVDRRPDAPPTGRMVSEETFLLQQLYSRGDPRLQDIVKSIQRAQDHIIRAPASRILVINGVAGSGKSSIAYHRLAYLLYPDTQSGIQPRRTIVFGPNRLFLSYVSSLLPSLGVNEVRQVTFDDWAMEQMGFAIYREGELRRRYRIQDGALQVFLSPHASPQERTRLWKRARLKGGDKFRLLIDAFVESRTQAFIIPRAGLAYSRLGDLGLTLALGAAEIETVYRQALAGGPPFDRIRGEVVSRLQSLLSTRFEKAVHAGYQERLRRAEDLDLRAIDRADRSYSHQAEALRESARQFRNRAFAVPGIRRQVVDAASQRLRQDIDRLWPPIDVYGDYYALISNRSALQRLGASFLTPDEVSMIVSSPPTGEILDIEDIPGMYYLHLHVRGQGESVYDHIVIDEAQDFSPLQFYILSRHTSSPSMTILGDLSQGIFGHRGLSDWEEIRPLFPPGAFQLEGVTQNYRATRQIVAFTNAVLLSVRGDQAALAQPLSRSGLAPRVVSVADDSAMYDAVCADIRALKDEGFQQLGLLVKSGEQCDGVLEQLQSRGVQAASAIDSRDAEFSYQGGLVVLPVALAKGIEFQAALVLGADALTYDGEVEYDGRLLYVAITRALHRLLVYSVGPLSPFLVAAVQQIGTNPVD